MPVPEVTINAIRNTETTIKAGNMAATLNRVVNNSLVLFQAPLSLFCINGVPITDFSIFADAINPKLILIDSTQPTGRRTVIGDQGDEIILDYQNDFMFSGKAVVFDAGGVGGIGSAWTKNKNIWLPNVWKFCFQATKGGSSAQYTMELEVFGVDPRPEDISDLASVI